MCVFTSLRLGIVVVAGVVVAAPAGGVVPHLHPGVRGDGGRGAGDRGTSCRLLQGGEGEGEGHLLQDFVK